MFLPFRGIFSIPLSIFIGRTEMKAIGGELLFQLIWAVGLMLLGQVLLHLLGKRVMTTGG